MVGCHVLMSTTMLSLKFTFSACSFFRLCPLSWNFRDLFIILSGTHRLNCVTHFRPTFTLCLRHLHLSCRLTSDFQTRPAVVTSLTAITALSVERTAIKSQYFWCLWSSHLLIWKLRTLVFMILDILLFVIRQFLVSMIQQLLIPDCVDSFHNAPSFQSLRRIDFENPAYDRFHPSSGPRLLRPKSTQRHYNHTLEPMSTRGI